jgi:hypothetical protein
MSRTLLSLAGFQVIISGRFWVIAEDQAHRKGETVHYDSPLCLGYDPAKRLRSLKEGRLACGRPLPDRHLSYSQVPALAKRHKVRSEEGLRDRAGASGQLAEEEDFGRGTYLVYSAGRFKAIHFRHGDIQNYNIRTKLFRTQYCLDPVRNFTDTSKSDSALSTSQIPRRTVKWSSATKIRSLAISYSELKRDCEKTVRWQ